jgi:hypothetical protein
VSRAPKPIGGLDVPHVPREVAFRLMKLHHPDRVRQRLIDRGLTDEQAAFLVRLVEREYGFMNPPEGEPVPVTLRLLAMMEFYKEALSDLDENDQLPPLPTPPAV